jgi:hypothetical protein
MTRLQAEALKYAVKRIDPGQHTLVFFGVVGDTQGELQCVCIHRGNMFDLTWEYLQQYCEDRVRSTRVRAQKKVAERRSNDDKMARVIIPNDGFVDAMGGSQEEVPPGED